MCELPPTPSRLAWHLHLTDSYSYQFLSNLGFTLQARQLLLPARPGLLELAQGSSPVATPIMPLGERLITISVHNDPIGEEQGATPSVPDRLPLANRC